MSTRSVWRTGTTELLGTILFSVQIYILGCLCSFSYSGALSMSTALLGGKKMVLFFFFLFPGQTTACPDMLSALGIGSGMCIGLLTETYTKYLSTGYLSETFPASVLVKRPWTIVCFWNGIASWVNGSSNTHRLSKFTAAFVQKKINVKMHLSSQQKSINYLFLPEYLNEWMIFFIYNNYSHGEDVGETKSTLHYRICTDSAIRDRNTC